MKPPANGISSSAGGEQETDSLPSSLRPTKVEQAKSLQQNQEDSNDEELQVGELATTTDVHQQ